MRLTVKPIALAAAALLVLSCAPASAQSAARKAAPAAVKAEPERHQFGIIGHSFHAADGEARLKQAIADESETALAFVVVAWSPALLVLAGAQALRRACDHAIARPAREVLFTVVSREAKYKAKNAIETVVYRGGDAASGWISAGLGALGVGFAGLAAIVVPLCAAWALLSLWLARAQERRLGDGSAR